MSKRPTIRDVARLAGVSSATVSYIINEQDGGSIQISEETRGRVRAAIAALNYTPNIIARSLSTQRTQLLAVMTPDITDVFYTLVFRGAQAATEPHGYDLMAFDCAHREDREHKFIDAVLRRRVDGVLMLTEHTRPEGIQALLTAGIQVVVIGHSPWVPQIDMVGLDEIQGVQQVIQHLHAKGHRRIAYLSGPLHLLSAQTRLRGYRTALAEHGLPYDEELVRYGTFTREGTAGLVESLFGAAAPAPRPTALFCGNDNMAIEAVRKLIRMGLRVPQDVAVAGFDNIPEAGLMIPSLTTIDHIPQVMGGIAADFLLERIGSKTPLEGRRQILTGQLVAREST